MREPSTADVIDSVLGLDPSSPIVKLRQQRADLKRLTQTSYEAALLPADPRNFSTAERAALAARMATLWNSAELAAHYRTLLESHGSTPALVSVCDPATALATEDARLAAILRHVDLVTREPKAATRENIEVLLEVGLDDRDVVTLAGLIAFVNYQVLVIAGLRMLRDH